MLLKILRNQKGSLLQSLIAGGILITGAAYVISKNSTDKKLANTVENKNQQTVFHKELSDVFSSADVCQVTMEKIDPLTAGQMTVTSVYPKTGPALFGVNSIIAGKKILSMKLAGYTPQPGFALSQAILTIDTIDEDQLVQKHKKVFSGGTGKTQIKILTLTQNNNIISCSSDQSGDVLAAFQAACSGLGGTFNSSTKKCDELHGNNGMLVKFVRQYLCKASGGGCSHPYANKICNQGKNYVLQGFKNDGTLDCYCIPTACPDPKDYCTGDSLGSNGCGTNCPDGNNDAKCGTTTGTTTGTTGTTTGTTGSTPPCASGCPALSGPQPYGWQPSSSIIPNPVCWAGPVPATPVGGVVKLVDSTPPNTGSHWAKCDADSCWSMAFSSDVTAAGYSYTPQVCNP